MEGHVRIGVGGDLMLGGSVLEKVREKSPIFPFENVIGKLPVFDLFLVNLECTLSTCNHPHHPSKTLLHSDPRVIKGMRKGGGRLAPPVR